MEIKVINRGSEGEFLRIGRLDSNSAPEIEEILREQVANYDKMILNLSSLDYISSAGLRLLKILHMDMKKKHGELTIRNCNSLVMEVFEMTGFAGLLTFE